jgi:hypothetical protein
MRSAWRRALFLFAVAGVAGCEKAPTPPVQVADRLVFLDSPTEVTAGLSINPPIRVGVLDRNGEPVPVNGLEVTLQLQGASNDTLRGLSTSVFIGGVAVFSGLSLDRVNTGLRFAAVAKKLAGVLSQPFTVNPGLASQLRFTTQPSDVVAGEPMSPAPVVEVQDAKGNRVPSFNGPVTMRIRTGVPAELQNATVNCSAGICTWPNLRITRSATGFTLLASTLGGVNPPISDATSGVFEVKPGAPARLGFRTGPINTLVNAVFSPPIQVAITDTLDNIVTTANHTVTLSFANNASGATLGGTLTLTASNGVATYTDVSVNKAGVNYRLQATAADLRTAFSNFFSVVASSFREGALRAAPSP